MKEKKLNWLIRLIKWFINLFKRKDKPQQPVTRSYAPEKIKKERMKIGPVKDIHNNRKNTRGRHTQYVDMGDGTKRSIFHSR